MRLVYQGEPLAPKKPGGYIPQSLQPLFNQDDDEECEKKKKKDCEKKKKVRAAPSSQGGPLPLAACLTALL